MIAPNPTPDTPEGVDFASPAPELPAVPAEALAVLKERFGFEAFRAGQEGVIAAVLAGRDVLCVMPTGGGKSLCYQLPALLKPGVTLVVSPLIALMKDQVDALTRRGIAAAEINSSVPVEVQEDTLDRAAKGEVRLLYVAPERFKNERFRRRIEGVGISLVAVDEAHCISQWGHDFRPDYRRLGPALEALGRPQVIALTATAPVEVQEDIVLQLKLREPLRVLDGLVRSNLHFEVVRTATADAKETALLKALKDAGPTIVYCATRKAVERVSDLLTSRRMPALRYHAGLEDDERSRAQESFLNGGAPLIVATNAFGMGVDRPDVRVVVHYDIPRTVEAYVQESGRAGRDGLPARCVLLHHPADLHIQRFFLESANPSREVVADVFRVLLQAGERRLELTADDIAERLSVDGSSAAVNTALAILDRAALVRRGRRDENLAHVTVNESSGDLFSITPLPPGLGRLLGALVEAFGVGRRRALDVGSMAARRDVTEETLRRGLQRLHDLGRVHYEPAFRGRATEVRVEGVPEDLLQAVDFDELDEKRRREEAKLDEMVGYAHARGCRRTYLVGCFGLRGTPACGACDLCRTEAARPARERARTAGGEALLLTVLKAVAAHDGRFGFGKLAGHLVGSRAAGVGTGPLSHGPTYGALAGQKQIAAERLLHQAHEDGLLSLEPHEIPSTGRRVHLVQLTREGRARLRGRTEPTRS